MILDLKKDNDLQHMSSLVHFLHIQQEANFILDSEYKIIYANISAKKLLEPVERGLEERYFPQIFTPYTSLVNLDSDLSIFKFPDSKPQTYTGQYKNRLFKVNIYPIEDFLVANVNEILVKKEEISFNKLKDKLNTFLMTFFDSIYLINHSWDRFYVVKDSLISANEALTKDEVVPKENIGRHIYFEDQKYVYRKISLGIEREKEFELEFRVLGERRKIIWVRSRFAPVLNEEGKVRGWMGVARDINDKKELELFQEDRRNNYFDLIESSILGTIVVDVESKEIHISSDWKKRLGLERFCSKRIYKEFHTKIHPDDREKIYKLRMKCLATKAPKYKAEYRLNTCDGQYIWVLGQCKIYYDEKGNLKKLYCTHIDISERKKVTQSLMENKKRAKELIRQLKIQDERKNNFIVNLSHELRNPLATISMGTSLIEQMPLEKEVNNILDIIKGQTAQLIRLTNDLFNITRIEKGKLELIWERVEINQLVKEIYEGYKAQFNKKNVTLNIELHKDKIYTEVDPVRIKQVVSNLLSNSLKFTEPGGKVDVLVSKDIDTIIRVVDTGIGIEAKYIADLFTPFSQLKTNLKTKTEGLGLGLPIIKGIVELHKGSIEVNSAGIGKGTEFVVRLPLNR